jgi:predicted RNA methylase
MSDISQFRRVDSWRATLGLLPVPLREEVSDAQRFILLNGSSGNFCLDFLGGIDRNARCAAAWSSDVGHYVTIDEESVIVNRWDRPASEERYSARSVLEQIHEFHRHLESATPDRSRNVITHVLKIFRRIRAAVRDSDDGKQSLQILLYLLASSAVGKSQVVDDPGAFGLTAEAIEISHKIPPATWDSLFMDLTGPGRYDVLRPEMDLVLRHAAGNLFQEAHLQAQIPLNMWLPGLERPATLVTERSSKDIGIYFTPPAIARTLAEEAVRALQVGLESPLVIFDPACGSGELLRECLRLLQLRGQTGKVRVLGWDKSDSSVDMARFILSWEKRSWPAGQVEVEITNTDSITAVKWPEQVDIVIMNPPFQSWQQMEAKQQAALSEVLGAKLRNKPNLAMAFAVRSLDTLKEHSVLAMITPNSLLEGTSGKHVREWMAERLAPVLIAKLGNQNLFAHAIVDAGMYVGRQLPVGHETSAILWADSQPNSLSRALRGLRRWRGAEIEPLNGEGFSVYLREDVGTSGSPWIARGYEAWVSYERLRRGRKTIAAEKIFEIKQGVRLGNDVFIVTKEYVEHLHKPEQRFFRPAVMNPSIVDAQLNDAYYVFYPYTTGLPEVATEEKLREHVRTYFDELLFPAKQKLSARKSLAKSPDLKWWDLIWHRTWLEEQAPRLVSKYFGATRPFAFDRDGKFVVVVGNAWLLNKGAVEFAITEREVYLATLAYLNSKTAEAMLQYVSVQVAGGQWDLSNRYVGKMPIPNFARMDSMEIAQLVKFGTMISEGQLERWGDLDEVVVSILKG